MQSSSRYCPGAYDDWLADFRPFRGWECTSGMTQSARHGDYDDWVCLITPFGARRGLMEMLGLFFRLLKLANCVTRDFFQSFFGLGTRFTLQVEDRTEQVEIFGLAWQR